MPIKKNKISLPETGQFSTLFIDYINGEKKLRTFYKYTPELSSFGEAINDRSKITINRDLLADVISDQYHSKVKASMNDFQKTNSNIELLRDKNTFSVCTGHQLCLFTGPLYFIYKIISTINLAEALKEQYPANHFVPVYWMASEDHDFEEIRSVHLFGKTITWEHPAPKGAVGRLGTSSLESQLDELAGILGESQQAKELFSLFQSAYLNHTNLADATRYLVHELFGSYGLVVIDADDKRLKAEFTEIIQDDIRNQTNFHLVNESISSLEKIGVKAQVNPREINVFHLNESRTRIEESSAAALSFSPEAYSPNVVLRPLYQQKILPNIAYVGGPGEIAYWLEYKAMFEHHGIMFPVLIPRNFALLSDEKTGKQMQKLDLFPSDIFRDQEQVIREYVKKNTQADLSMKEEEQKLVLIYAEIAEKAASIDPTLKASVEAEMQKALNALKNLEQKVLRSEKQKQESSINQIRKLREKFLPEGVLQERYENMAPYYLKFGKHLIPMLKEAFKPFEFEMLILELN